MDTLLTLGAVFETVTAELLEDADAPMESVTVAEQ